MKNKNVTYRVVLALIFLSIGIFLSITTVSLVIKIITTQKRFLPAVPGVPFRFSALFLSSVVFMTIGIDQAIKAYKERKSAKFIEYIFS